MSVLERIGPKAETALEDLENLSTQYPALQEEFGILKNFLEKKLFYEFGEKCKEVLFTIYPKYGEPQPIFVQVPETPTEDHQYLGGVEFLWRIVATYRSRIRPLTFIEMMSATAYFLAAEDAISWITKFESDFQSANAPNFLLQISKSIQTLRAGKVKESEEIMEAVSDKMQEKLDVETSVHAEFHRVMASMFRAQEKWSDMYNHANLFLQFRSIGQLSNSQCCEVFKEISIAMLLSPVIYDFGEILYHPISSFVKNTTEEWIMDILRAYNEGQMALFDECIQRYKLQMENTKLRGCESFLKEKMARMTLMEISFQKTKSSQPATFEEISAVCGVNLLQVERLVIRSMCHQLIGGYIDQVAKQVHVDWVKPRVLDNPRLDLLVQHVSNWEKKTVAALDFVEMKLQEKESTLSDTVQSR
eukprot:GHVP01002321.1.p1 GENE.GHVP01002321.1~~GHVP01002321.1.p1  ORF type:complete len:418 (-),score=98.16 GHVP01002321.1:183-1436(-)